MKKEKYIEMEQKARDYFKKAGIIVVIYNALQWL